MWQSDGGTVSAYIHWVAGKLVALAKEWVKLSGDHI
jgi:hypothetical protein